MKLRQMSGAWALSVGVLYAGMSESYACTGITLRAADSAVVYGRTMEWGSFDLHSRLVIVPRGYKYTGHTPDGKPGMSWQAKYGVAGIDAVAKDMIVDGMNEKGLAVGLFYHPGYAGSSPTRQPMPRGPWPRRMSDSTC